MYLGRPPLDAEADMDSRRHRDLGEVISQARHMCRGQILRCEAKSFGQNSMTLPKASPLTSQRVSARFSDGSTSAGREQTARIAPLFISFSGDML